jgi:hypothetical protein
MAVIDLAFDASVHQSQQKKSLPLSLNGLRVGEEHLLQGLRSLGFPGSVIF